MHDISVAILCSGSSGNSILVSHDESGILIDAGISCRELEKRLSLFGVEPTQIEAVLLTHEHTDHTRGVRKFCSEHKLAAYGTRGTLALTPLEGITCDTVIAGQTISLNGLVARPFRVSHLAAEPVAYTISSDSVKIGIASDLGCVTPNVVKEMSGSDIMLVEANYDDDMLMSGDYPDFLKRAIRSDHGHLSNKDAGILSMRASSDRTRKIVLLHLSKENNTPEKAKGRVKQEIERTTHRPHVEVVGHGESSGPYRLSC